MAIVLKNGIALMLGHSCLLDFPNMNAQFKNIHLICASNKVSPLEMAVPMVDDLMVLQDGVKMFDAYLNREVLVLAPVITCMCDNPRASELVGHLRGSPNAYCCQYLVSMMLMGAY